MNTTHPFLRSAVTINIDELRQKLDAAGIEPTICSPFMGLKVGPDIAGKPDSGPFVDPMIRSLAQSRSRLQLITLSEGVSASFLDFFFTGDLAYTAYIQDHTLCLSAGLAINELADMIIEQLTATTLLSVRSQIYESGYIRLAIALWRGGGFGLSQSIPKQQAIRILTDSGVARDHRLNSAAAEALDRATALGYFRQTKGRIELDSALRYWMELLWSGHFLELIYSHTCADQSMRCMRLMFAGPAGSRFLITEPTVKSSAPGWDPVGIEHSVRFAHLARNEASDLVRPRLAF